MPWRTGSVVDLPALLLSVTGGVTAPTPRLTFVIVHAPDEFLVGDGEIRSGAAIRAARRGRDVRAHGAPIARGSTFTLFQNYTVWLNIVMANGSIAGRVHRGT